MLTALRAHADSLVGKGLFHIFGASALNRAIAFITNILIVRLLTKGDYGLFSYANSIYAIVLLFTGLGLVSGMFVHAAENRPEQEREGLCRYALTRGLLIDCALMLALVVAGLVIPFPIEQSGPYVAMFAPLLILDYVFSFLATFLRIKRENKKYAGLTNVNTACYCVFGCCGAWVGGIAGTIVGRYLAYAVSILVGLLMVKHDARSFKRRAVLSRPLKRSLWSFSLKNQAAAALNCMSYALQAIILGIVLQNSGDIAAYKTASIIPEGLAFVTSSVTIFLAPYIIAHNDDGAWLKKTVRVVFTAMGFINLAIALVFFFMSSHIVLSLWGASYSDAIIPFQILALNYFVSGTFRSIAIEMLSCLKKTGYNLFLAIVWCAINVCGTFMLAGAWGVRGAALSVVLNSAVSGLLSVPYLIHVINKANKKGKRA